MYVQIHVQAADLRRLAPTEDAKNRKVWRVVTDTAPRRYIAVCELSIDHGADAVTHFPDGRHGEAWLRAHADNVRVRVDRDAPWILASNLIYAHPYDTDERP